jgi:D-alanine transfer protein
MGATGPGRPHLFSGVIACGIAVATLFAGQMIAIHLEHKTLHAFAPRVFQLKNQGLAFQRLAAQAPDVLPFYGSSELITPLPERAGIFFRTAPTGFQVSPIGKVGTPLLIMLQKLAALGYDLRGKKVAISLSAVWFMVPDLTPYWYDGNFSLFAASELVFGSPLDFNLKQQIASRMLQFPQPLRKSPLLEFALRRLASGGPLNYIIVCALWPLGKVQDAIFHLQDHFEALIYILRQLVSASHPHADKLDWPGLIAKASEKASARENEKGKALDADKEMVAGHNDAWFLQRMNAARQWVDLELLLRVLTKIHAQPLLLSTPMDGQFYDQAGVSPSVRECYYNKLRALAQRYNFPLVGFEQHDEDATFLSHRVPRIKHIPASHLTAKGWMFYDRALDDFFHGRVPRT